MKIIDENGKLFGKLNLVDLGIILLVIFAIVTVGAKLLKDSSESGAKTTISYTVFVEGVRQQSIDAINKNYENITEAEKKDALGKIVKIEKEPSVIPVEMMDGTYKELEQPDKFNLYITLEVMGNASSNGYFTESGKKLIWGDTLVLNNNYSRMTGKIEQIKGKE